MQTLEQFLENCSVEDLRRKATARLAEITSITTYWHKLISDMSVHIANKEKAAALQSLIRLNLELSPSRGPALPSMAAAYVSR